MLEAHRLNSKTKISIGDYPGLGQSILVPRATTTLASLVAGVCSVPQGVLLLGVPNDLWVGTNKTVFAPKFQLLTGGGVHTVHQRDVWLQILHTSILD